MVENRLLSINWKLLILFSDRTAIISNLIRSTNYENGMIIRYLHVGKGVLVFDVQEDV